MAMHIYWYTVIIQYPAILKVSFWQGYVS